MKPACDRRPVSHVLFVTPDSTQAGIHTRWPGQLRQSECE